MSTTLTTTPAAATGSLVVARFLDGRTVKGTTQDFAPAKERFHIFPNGDRSANPVEASANSIWISRARTSRELAL